jgi:hypothetical protein
VTSARVLATQQARDAAKQLLAATGPLKDQIAKLIQQGHILADANQWDGSLAQKWRGEWEADVQQLQTASGKLDELEKRAQQAVEAIMHAGGS